MVTKNKKMSIRISEGNIDRIHHKAKLANKNFTDYVTDCCLGRQIVVVNGLDEVIKQQKALGRNLNQLTTLANMGKVSVAYLDEAVGAFTAINKSLQEILERRRWSDGNS